jgi:hypothetical protein
MEFQRHDIEVLSSPGELAAAADVEGEGAR